LIIERKIFDKSHLPRNDAESGDDFKAISSFNRQIQQCRHGIAPSREGRVIHFRARLKELLRHQELYCQRLTSFASGDRAEDPLYSAAVFKASLIVARSASIGASLPARCVCQKVQPLQAGRP
jgi:hypothetical protein